ncbi:hypothetical protein TKK_0016547 [Trichogramma kaykai]
MVLDRDDDRDQRYVQRQLEQQRLEQQRLEQQQALDIVAGDLAAAGGLAAKGALPRLQPQQNFPLANLGAAGFRASQNLCTSVDKIKSHTYVRNIPFNIVSPFNEYRKQYQLMILRKRCNGILISIKQLINDILTETIEVKFEIVLRLSNVYEEIFNFSSDFGFLTTNMIHIDAPKMMNPTKIKMPNIFQSIAESYQEEVCSGLSRFFSIKENCINDSDQDSVDSSIDTYNTLTGTLLISTSVTIARISEHQENFMKHIFDEIMLNLKEKLQDLICTIDQISPIASSFKRWDIRDSKIL